MAERNDSIAESVTSPPASGSTSKLNNSVPPKRAGHEKHAELFRKDLISAMKLPDTEVLQYDEYFLITDTWKLEWERGVQVPVDPDAIPPLVVGRVSQPETGDSGADSENAFILPKKLLYSSTDENFKPVVHELYDSTHRMDKICRYDLDELDTTWLAQYNRLREEAGEAEISESDMETMMEAFEMQCHANLQQAIRTVDGLGIEYDENVVCDICRSPDGEDSNEMVFCDACDICVHQACYGIQNIPEGNWLCRTCALNIQPRCLLCPKTGGAMKSTKSGTKWAHISCALWIPEVTIDCPDKMEPITNISQIPSSRWALLCSLCRERVGACIQCSVKACKTSFHVTCAFQYGLDLKTTFDEDSVDVQLKAFCLKHSSKKDDRRSLVNDIDESMTDEERTELRSHRLKKLGEEFYEHVDSAEVADMLGVDVDTVDCMCSYWILKRKAGFDRPLLMPKVEEVELLTKQREDTLIARMKMFVHLRQDLERVRNLCYMVNKREKTRSLVYQMKEDIFHQEAALAELEGLELTAAQVRETKITPLPKFCHHSTGTVYDHPEGILRMARLFEERGQMLDRKNLSISLQKTSTPLHSKTRLASDVSPTRSRRNRQNARPARADVDGIATSPTASRSPIQQLFRDKMEGLESGGWVASSSLVKTDDAGEASGETSVTLPISSEKVDTVAIPGTVSPTFTASSNDFVKMLNAADNQKLSSSRPVDDEGERNKSVDIEEMPLTGATHSNTSAVLPAVTAAADSHDTSQTDQLSSDSKVVTSHSDKLCTSRENDHIKTEAGDSENLLETAKVKATKSGSRSAVKKKDPSKESRASKVDSDTTPREQARRRASKDQLNHMTDKSMSCVSEKPTVSRSGRKTRSTEHVDDSIDIVAKEPAASKSVNLKRVGSLSTSRLGNEKSRENDKVHMQGALGCKSDSGLQQELPNDDQDKPTTDKGQKVPLQDSSALNQNTLTESIVQQAGNWNSDTAADGASLTGHVPLNSETSDRPYFHCDNFRLVGVAQNQHTSSLQSLKYEAIYSDGSASVEPTRKDDGAAEVADSGANRLVNSPKHGESEKRLNDESNILLPESSASEPESVKKATSSSSRSRPRSRRSVRGVDATEELDGDVEKDGVLKEDSIKKKSVRRRRKTIDSVDADAVSVGERSESRAVNQTDVGASRDSDILLTLDNNVADTKCQTSTNKSETELPASVVSESPVASAATENHTELTSSVFAVADQRSDVTDVDYQHTGLKSIAKNSLKSPRNLAPNLLKLDISTCNLGNTKASLHDDSMGAALSAKNVWKSGLNDVVSQPSELGKTSASSRKRAAHLMAGCRHRTVGVKRPPPTIEETSDQHMETDVNDKYDQLPMSEHLAFIRTDLDSDRSASDTYSQLHTPRHMPFVQTDSSVSRSAESLAQSSNHFLQITSTTDISDKSISRLNSCGTDDVSEEVTKSKLTSHTVPAVVKDSLWKDGSSQLHERPQVMRYDSAGGGCSKSSLSRTDSKTLTSPTVVTDGKDSRRESVRAELLRKFLPSKLIVSDSIKRRVQDGLQLLASIRSASTICSHTRQKLADYLNQSRKETTQERLPLRPIDDKHDPSDTSLRRRLPVRPHRRVYSEWEYVSGEEFTSAVSDVESNSDSDYSVDFEDLAVSEESIKSSRSLVGAREHRLSTVHH